MATPAEQWSRTATGMWDSATQRIVAGPPGDDFGNLNHWGEMSVMLAGAHYAQLRALTEKLDEVLIELRRQNRSTPD